MNSPRCISKNKSIFHALEGIKIQIALAILGILIYLSNIEVLRLAGIVLIALNVVAGIILYIRWYRILRQYEVLDNTLTSLLQMVRESK
jgi:Flp pilus assembly protein TadB